MFPMQWRDWTQNGSKRPALMSFARVGTGWPAVGQPLSGHAPLGVFDTIEGLIPAKGNFCINGSQSL
jgi:hypothetical protein